MNVQTLKKPKFTWKGLYVALILLAFGGLSGLVLIRTVQLSVVFLLMQLAALTLGFGHARLLYRIFPRLSPDNLLPSALTTLGLNAAGAASLAVALHMLGSSPGLAVSALLFSLPFFVLVSFRRFRQIPPREYKMWYYPAGSSMPDLDMLDLTKILVVQFEFPKRASDSQPTNFKAKAPVEMRFGGLFFIFLNDYQEQHPDSPIQYLDDQNQPFGWVFYRKSVWWQPRKYFDAGLSFRDNQVADNEIIICERG
jgi:hypothetical protein